MDDFYNLDAQLNQIIDMGNKQVINQKEKLRELRDQKQIIKKNCKNSKNAQSNIKDTHRKLNLISWRVKVYILTLYGIAIVLFLIII